jgi:DUF971 family protein
MLPVDIRRPEPGKLIIEWDDGHVSEYSMLSLRRQCPCASCLEKRTARSDNPLRVLSPEETLAQNPEVKTARVVGNYALQFDWKDGHNEGIYTFDYLRELCECKTCQEERKATTAST